MVQPETKRTFLAQGSYHHSVRGMITDDVAGKMQRTSETLMTAQQWIWQTNVRNRLLQQTDFTLSLHIKSFTGVCGGKDSKM